MDEEYNDEGNNGVFYHGPDSGSEIDINDAPELQPIENYPGNAQLNWPVKKINHIYDNGMVDVSWANTVEKIENLVGCDQLLAEAEKKQKKQENSKREKEEKAKQRQEKRKLHVGSGTSGIQKKKKKTVTSHHTVPLRRSARLNKFPQKTPVSSSHQDDDYIPLQPIIHKNMCLSPSSNNSANEEYNKWLTSRFRPHWGSSTINDEITHNEDLSNLESSLHQPKDTIKENVAAGEEPTSEETVNLPFNEAVTSSSATSINEKDHTSSITTAPSEVNVEEEGMTVQVNNSNDDVLLEETTTNFADVNLGCFTSRITISQEFTCDICDKPLSSRRNLLLHVKIVHQVEALQKDAYKSIGCQLCCAQVASKIMLKFHMKNNHPTGKVNCVFCKDGKTGFESFLDLKAHIDSVHDKSIIHQCDDCHQFFNRKFNLFKHTKRCVVKKKRLAEED